MSQKGWFSIIGFNICQYVFFPGGSPQTPKRLQRALGGSGGLLCEDINHPHFASQSRWISHSSSTPPSSSHVLRLTGQAISPQLHWVSFKMLTTEVKKGRIITVSLQNPELRTNSLKNTGSGDNNANWFPPHILQQLWKKLDHEKASQCGIVQAAQMMYNVSMWNKNRTYAADHFLLYVPLLIDIVLAFPKSKKDPLVPHLSPPDSYCYIATARMVNCDVNLVNTVNCDVTLVNIVNLALTKSGSRNKKHFL
jgi:hypothetical protein